MNHQDGSPEGKEGKDAEPAVKKPKGVEKSKAALLKKKSSLRRYLNAQCLSCLLVSRKRDRAHSPGLKESLPMSSA